MEYSGKNAPIKHEYKNYPLGISGTPDKMHSGVYWVYEYPPSPPPPKKNILGFTLVPQSWQVVYKWIAFSWEIGIRIVLFQILSNLSSPNMSTPLFFLGYKASPLAKLGKKGWDSLWCFGCELMLFIYERYENYEKIWKVVKCWWRHCGSKIKQYEDKWKWTQ